MEVLARFGEPLPSRDGVLMVRLERGAPDVAPIVRALDDAGLCVRVARPGEGGDQQQRLVSQEEITRQAERAAEEIVEDANTRAREIRLGAEDYADEILNTLEVNLQKFTAAVQRGRDRLAGEQEPAEVG
jgi:hypothetical protein